MVDRPRTGSGPARCPKCMAPSLVPSSTVWVCDGCGHRFACFRGMPRLCLDEAVGLHDRKLRDTLYNGLFGAFYAFLMPFIVLPVRPFSTARLHWLLYLLVCAVLAGLAVAGLAALSAGALGWACLALGPLLLAGAALARQTYLLHLLWLAIPTKWSVARSQFRPEETFAAVHERALAAFAGRNERLAVLDVSTGSCNSLYKHGWMGLNADYTAIDLSETMLAKGQAAMAQRGVPVDLVLGDAANLPFQSAAFDVVLNYGAINGMTNPQQALAEMARVLKPGGLMLFLDEQIYPGATPIQRRYFHKVLSSHNVIHHCPVEWLAPELEDVRVAQVYEFYYICTARKRAGWTAPRPGGPG